jgi:hypothetical protein
MWDHKRKLKMRLLCLCLFVAVGVAAVSAADLKVKTVRHYSSVPENRADQSAPADQDWTRTELTYVHGPMRRFEYRDGEGKITQSTGGLRHAAHIENCETRESMILDLDANEYRSSTYPSDDVMRSAAAQRQADRAKDVSQLKMLAESNTIDTGETARMFGYTAHHFITTTQERPQGEASVLLGRREEITIDAWYADAKVDLPMRGCEPKDLVESIKENMRSELLDERHTGPTPHGFPLKVKRVAHITNDTPAGSTALTETLETTVIEISDAPLDPSLFAAPPSFKHVTCLRGQPCGGK